MKIKNGFILREIAGSSLVMPVGEMAEKVSGMIELSSTGAILWKRLELGATEEELVAEILSKFDIEEETAKADVAEFVNYLKAQDWIEE